MDRETSKALKSFISRNVQPPQKGFVTKFWPKEIKLAKELFVKFPDVGFWQKIKLDKPVYSLSWFKTKDGEKVLNTKYMQFTFKPQSAPKDVLEISSGKFGESTHNKREKKFISDFLN